MKCKPLRGVLAHALPIRTTCVNFALASMEKVVSMDGWGWFYRTMNPYNAKVLDKVFHLDMDLPFDGLLPIETARTRAVPLCRPGVGRRVQVRTS